LAEILVKNKISQEFLDAVFAEPSYSIVLESSELLDYYNSLSEARADSELQEIGVLFPDDYRIDTPGSFEVAQASGGVPLTGPASSGLKDGSPSMLYYDRIVETGRIDPKIQF